MQQLSLVELITLAQAGNSSAAETLIDRYDPLISKLSRQYGIVNEDCKQQLIMDFIIAIWHFDLNRYK